MTKTISQSSYNKKHEVTTKVASTTLENDVKNNDLKMNWAGFNKTEDGE